MYTSIFEGRSRRQSQQQRNKRRFNLACESLEGRQLLSSTPLSLSIGPVSDSLTYGTTLGSAMNPATVLNASGSGRIAACWYSNPSFTVNVNLTDGQTHDLELYFLDWDSTARGETVQISDASTGAVLNTETVTSFNSGVYLDWAVSGNVDITITQQDGANAVLSGLFFDPPTTPATPTSGPTASFIKQDTTTQGTWIGTYGSQGYDVIGNAASQPSYATVTPAGQASNTWAASSTDPRALQDFVTGTFDFKNGSDDVTDSVLDVGHYDLSVTFYPTDIDYNSVTTTASITITPAQLQITAANATRMYGQDNPDLTSEIYIAQGTGWVDTGQSWTADTTATTNSAVDSYAIQPTVITDPAFLNNYDVSYVTGELTVTQAPLTITANNVSMNYADGTTLDEVNGFTPVGLQNGETVGSVKLVTDATVSGSGNWNVGTWAITPSAATDGTFNPSNYDVSYVTGELTVTAAPLTVTANNVSMTYADGRTLDGVNGFTPVVLQNGETVGSVTLVTDATVSGSGNWNVGTWTITPSEATGGTFNPSNYTITYVAGTLRVGAKSVSITGVAAHNKPYDGTNAAELDTSSEAIPGAVSGDSVSITDGISTFADPNVGNGKPVTASGFALGGNDVGDYSLSGQPGDLSADITRAGLTITATDVSMTYADGTTLDEVNGFTPVGLQNGETVGSVTLATNATLSGSGNWNAGTWAITPSAATGGTFNPNNYTITYDNGLLIIDKATLIVTANNTTMVLGGPVPTFSAYYIGLVKGDTVSSLGNLGSLEFTPVNTTSQGSSAITLTGSLTSSDYTIVYDPGTLTVTTTKPIIHGLPPSKKLS